MFNGIVHVLCNIRRYVNITGVFLSTNVRALIKSATTTRRMLIFLVATIIIIFSLPQPPPGKSDSAESMEINLESEINDGEASARQRREQASVFR